MHFIKLTIELSVSNGSGVALLLLHRRPATTTQGIWEGAPQEIRLERSRYPHFGVDHPCDPSTNMYFALLFPATVHSQMASYRLDAARKFYLIVIQHNFYKLDARGKCIFDFTFRWIIPLNSTSKPPKSSSASFVVCDMWIFMAKILVTLSFYQKIKYYNLRSPVDSILLAVLTVSPKRQYLGILVPTTPATTGPVLIPTLILKYCVGLWGMAKRLRASIISRLMVAISPACWRPLQSIM